MRRIISISLYTFIALFSGLSAQNEVDALRFSKNNVIGTARSVSLGGAMTAVGADYSSIYYNPAGLALYRRSDLHITPRFKVISNETQYLNNSLSSLSSSFGIGSAGYVIAKRKKLENEKDKSEGKDLKFTSFTFAFGVNQTESFKRRTIGDAFNPYNSITERFAEMANGFTTNDLQQSNSYAGLAANSNMIYESFDTPGYWLPSVNGGNINQSFVLNEKGYQNEYSLAFAGGLKDFIYIGGGINLEQVRYDYDLDYSETDVDNLHNALTPDSVDVQWLNFTDEYRTSGTGVNARLGIIVRPLDFLRIGVSVQTPTWYTLTDQYYANMVGKRDSDVQSFSLLSDYNNEGRYRYNLISPYRMNVGVMFIYKKLGFFTADVELMNYAMSRFTGSGTSQVGSVDPFAIQNKNMQDMFKLAYNIRTGLEVRYSVLRFRGGFGMQGSALDSRYLEYYDFMDEQMKTLAGNTFFFSGGLGFKLRNFYLDLSYVRENSKDRKLMYQARETSNLSPEIVNNKKTNSIHMTIGFTF